MSTISVGWLNSCLSSSAAVDALRTIAAAAAAAVARIPAAAIAFAAAAPVVAGARPERLRAQRTLRPHVEGPAQKVCPLHDAIATFAAARKSNQLPGLELRAQLRRDAEAHHADTQGLRLYVRNIPFDQEPAEPGRVEFRDGRGIVKNEGRADRNAARGDTRGNARNERVTRMERAERPERMERVERPERAERAERVERVERVERPD